MFSDKFEYVLAVAEEQTLTKAAKRLYVSQPTLTNYLNRLEDELGVKLFDRSTTPIKATAAGQLYIERMKKIQLESRILQEELRQMGRKRTTFTFGIGSARGSHWLVHIMPDFIRAFPHTAVKLYEAGEDRLEKGLLKGEIDMAVGVLNTSFPRLKYHDIALEKVCLAVPRSLACRAGIPQDSATAEKPLLITADDVKNIPFLIPYADTGFYRCAGYLMKQAGLYPAKTMTYGNMNTAYQLCARGVGALFLTPDVFLKSYPGLEKNIAFCTLQPQIYTRTCVAAYRPDNGKKEMIDFLLDTIKKKIPQII